MSFLSMRFLALLAPPSLLASSPVPSKPLSFPDVKKAFRESDNARAYDPRKHGIGHDLIFLRHGYSVVNHEIKTNFANFEKKVSKGDNDNTDPHLIGHEGGKKALENVFTARTLSAFIYQVEKGGSNLQNGDHDKSTPDHTSDDTTQINSLRFFVSPLRRTHETLALTLDVMINQINAFLKIEKPRTEEKIKSNNGGVDQNSIKVKMPSLTREEENEYLTPQEIGVLERLVEVLSNANFEIVSNLNETAPTYANYSVFYKMRMNPFYPPVADLSQITKDSINDSSGRMQNLAHGERKKPASCDEGGSCMGDDTTTSASSFLSKGRFDIVTSRVSSFLSLFTEKTKQQLQQTFKEVTPTLKTSDLPDRKTILPENLPAFSDSTNPDNNKFWLNIEKKYGFFSRIHCGNYCDIPGYHFYCYHDFENRAEFCPYQVGEGNETVYKTRRVEKFYRGDLPRILNSKANYHDNSGKETAAKKTLAIISVHSDFIRTSGAFFEVDDNVEKLKDGVDPPQVQMEAKNADGAKNVGQKTPSGEPVNYLTTQSYDVVDGQIYNHLDVQQTESSKAGAIAAGVKPIPKPHFFNFASVLVEGVKTHETPLCGCNSFLETNVVGGNGIDCCSTVTMLRGGHHSYGKDNTKNSDTQNSAAPSASSFLQYTAAAEIGKAIMKSPPLDTYPPPRPKTDRKMKYRNMKVVSYGIAESAEVIYSIGDDNSPYLKRVREIEGNKVG